eukprot:3518767-Pyramimonas_sp.AAC.1
MDGETDLFAILDHQRQSNVVQLESPEAMNVEPESEVVNPEATRAKYVNAIFPKQVKQYLIKEVYDYDQNAPDLLWQDAARRDHREPLTEEQRCQVDSFARWGTRQLDHLWKDISSNLITKSAWTTPPPVSMLSSCSCAFTAQFQSRDILLGVLPVQVADKGQARSHADTALQWRVRIQGWLREFISAHAASRGLEALRA